MKKLPFIAFFIIFLSAGAGYTADEPIVRAGVSPEEVIVGSEVTLTVTVLVPTWFSKSPAYPSMEMEGVVTVLPPDSTYAMSERLEGNTWAGITREYKLYPLERGIFDLRKKYIGVTHADPEARKPIHTTLFLPELRFSAVTPAGAENLDPFLSGSSLELIQEISMESDIYRPGDAIERHITARLEGMPGMFIPTLISQYEEPGISIYPGTSRTEDEHEEDTKTVTGVRKEAVTYVFERGGTYAFPPVTLHWWNTKTEQVETAEIPPLLFNVKKSFAQQIEDLPRLIVFAIALIVLALTLFIAYFRKSIYETLTSSWTRYYSSEQYAFLRAIRRVLFRDRRTAYLGILGWQKRIGPDSAYAPASKSRSSFLVLEDSIYGPEPRKVSYGLALRGKLVSELLIIRSGIRTKQGSSDSGISLNPL